MNFSELYNNNRKAVERALIAMWCGESNNDSQRSYIKQMKALIGDLFAPKNAVPVVQCIIPIFLCLLKKPKKQKLWWVSFGTSHTLLTSISISAGICY